MSRDLDIGGLMRWLDDAVWEGLFKAVLEQHLGRPAEAAGIAVEELPDVIGKTTYMALWGFAFEDLITRRLPDGRVLVSDYRKRRGWKESAAVRAYLEALAKAVPSVYEVSDIVPGEGMALRDLVRGGEPVRVTEHTASRSVKPWDRIATRVVTVRGRTVISGGVLAFDHPTSDALIEAILRVAQATPEKAASLLAELPAELAREVELAAFEGELDIDAVLRSSPFIMSTFWLRDHLDKISRAASPTVVSREGEPIEPVTVRWRLAKGVRVRRMQSLLDGLPALRPASAAFWNWVDDAPEPAARKETAVTVLSTTMDDGALVLGNVEIADRELVLSTMTPSRAERGQALLEAAVGELIEDPEIERQPLELTGVTSPGPHQPPPGISAEEERAIIHEELTAHYRRCVDDVIPDLGDVSPRQLLATAQGREKVVGWLKYLENGIAVHRDGPMAGYDLTWLWEELGLGGRRR